MLIINNLDFVAVSTRQGGLSTKAASSQAVCRVPVPTCLKRSSFKRVRIRMYAQKYTIMV